MPKIELSRVEQAELLDRIDAISKSLTQSALLMGQLSSLARLRRDAANNEYSSLSIRKKYYRSDDHDVLKEALKASMQKTRDVLERAESLDKLSNKFGTKISVLRSKSSWLKTTKKIESLSNYLESQFEPVVSKFEEELHASKWENSELEPFIEKSKVEMGTALSAMEGIDALVQKYTPS